MAILFKNPISCKPNGAARIVGFYALRGAAGDGEGEKPPFPFRQKKVVILRSGNAAT